MQGSATTTRPAKKKIETALPLGKITEKTPVAPKPKETSSLPTGSFCSRCGNRVPFNSTFCNHCGTPVKHPSERTSASKPVITRVPVPPPVSKPVVTESQIPVPPSADQPVIPQVPVPPLTPPSPVTKVTLPPPVSKPVIANHGTGSLSQISPLYPRCRYTINTTVPRYQSNPSSLHPNRRCNHGVGSPFNGLGWGTPE